MEHARPSRGEEIASSITHGAGALLSVAGLVVLVVRSSQHGDAWRIVSCAVFGTCLVQLYLTSTLYHALTHLRAKRVFQILDHSAIYLLIAGTYTPFTLVTLRGDWGWSLFGVIWGLAAAGIVFKSFATGRLHVLSNVIYLLMGWCGVVALKPLLLALSPTGFAWLLAGGLAYTAGVAFYASRRRYAHAVWHLFVLAGSGCHYWAVFRYVAAKP